MTTTMTTMTTTTMMRPTTRATTRRTTTARRAMALARRETRAMGVVARARAGAEEKVAVTSACGAVALATINAMFPEHASALSIRDPVFGDIEVWQFLVLTAGYFIGIEIYLDKKYDDNNKTVMPTVQKKKESDEETSAEE